MMYNQFKSNNSSDKKKVDNSLLEKKLGKYRFSKLIMYYI